jgi:hypothetical protein
MGFEMLPRKQHALLAALVLRALRPLQSLMLLAITGDDDQSHQTGKTFTISFH